MVTFLMATTRRLRCSSVTRSSSRKGKRWGMIPMICRTSREMGAAAEASVGAGSAVTVVFGVSSIGNNVEAKIITYSPESFCYAGERADGECQTSIGSTRAAGEHRTTRARDGVAGATARRDGVAYRREEIRRCAG